MSLYTKYGDQGYTYTKISVKTPKNHSLVHFLGNLDELNCSIGLLYSLLCDKNLTELAIVIKDIMSLNFEIGAYLGYGTLLDFVKVESLVAIVEKNIDTQEKANGELRNFILPTGSHASCVAHTCRAISRRTERSIYELEITAECECIIMFLNRISDYFFSIARTMNRLDKVQEIIWAPQK